MRSTDLRAEEPTRQSKIRLRTCGWVTGVVVDLDSQGLFVSEISEHISADNLVRGMADGPIYIPFSLIEGVKTGE